MLNFSEVGSQFSDPRFLLTVLLTFSVVLVNGWTDAPNAISSAVLTRAMKPNTAILMAAVMNFAGAVLMTEVNDEVFQTICNITSFEGKPLFARTALCAAMTAIVLWAVAAWRFGIPTSESHALTAGLTGAAVSLNGGFSGIRADEWKKVLLGLLLSSILGFAGGLFCAGTVRLACRGVKRSGAIRFFRRMEVIGAAATAFLHGAQDGQKFTAVFLLCLSFAKDGVVLSSPPLFLTVVTAAVMAFGTALGGRKIIAEMGRTTPHFEVYQGFSADTASAACLLISTILGFPVSTTHTKTAAATGAAAAEGLKKVRWSEIRSMVLAWILTFPACGLLAFFVAGIFLKIFTGGECP